MALHRLSEAAYANHVTADNRCATPPTSVAFHPTCATSATTTSTSLKDLAPVGEIMNSWLCKLGQVGQVHRDGSGVVLHWQCISSMTSTVDNIHHGNWPSDICNIPTDGISQVSVYLNGMCVCARKQHVDCGPLTVPVHPVCPACRIYARIEAKKLREKRDVSKHPSERTRLAQADPEKRMQL